MSATAPTRKVRLVVETAAVIRIHLDDGSIVELDKSADMSKLKKRFGDSDEILERHFKRSATLKWPTEILGQRAKEREQQEQAPSQLSEKTTTQESQMEVEEGRLSTSST